MYANLAQKYVRKRNSNLQFAASGSQHYRFHIGIYYVNERCDATGSLIFMTSTAVAGDWALLVSQSEEKNVFN